MSTPTDSALRSRYGSTWIATRSPCACAASMTSGRRSSSSDPLPHQEIATSWTPIEAISSICCATTTASALE